MSTKDFVSGWVTGDLTPNVDGCTLEASAIIRILLVVFITYLICLGSYRLFLSPLARVPGPKVAALTYWYETYYEVWKGGQYFKEVAEMHKKYGPMVRVSPGEVHFDDPDFIETLYPSRGKKVDKPETIAIRAGTPGSIVATVEHDKHRRRRNALVSFFSGASVRRLEPIIKSHVEQLLLRLGESDSPKTGRIFEMHHVFKACMSDLITQYAFGDSLHFLDQKDFGRSYYETSDKLHHLTHVVGNWPWLFALGESVPRLSRYVTMAFFPSTGEFLDKQAWWISKVREIRGSMDPEIVANTIFGGILNSSLPEEDKTDGRLANEAQLVVLGGEGTTSHALTAALYHLLANPNELQRLKDEIHTALPGPAHIPNFSQVNGLPFLNAVINETIRLHPGVMNRHTRIFPEDPVVYVHKSKGVEYRLPAGTVMSMSPLISHMNATVFIDPYEFRPQRWLDNPEIARAFIGFSRGTRGCIGMALARHEMTMTLASLLLKYDIYRGQEGPSLELYDTVRERDVDANRDYVLPQPAEGSRGLRVRVRA